MPITYKASNSEGIVTAVWIGDVSIADLREHLGRLLQDENAMALRKSLSDLRGAKLLFSEQELHLAVREVVAPLLKGRDWISAIVVRTPAQFQMGSKYQGVALAYSNDAIFSHLDEAKRWLLKQQLREEESGRKARDCPDPDRRAYTDRRGCPKGDDC